jgi:hypothetical protein
LKNSQECTRRYGGVACHSANTQKSAEIKQFETLTSICRNDSEDNHEFPENMFDEEHKIMRLLKTQNSLQ